METSRILELAATIQKSVTAIHNKLAEGALPFPSFEVNASTSLPEELSQDQDVVLDATAELHDLLLEPLNLLFQHGGVSVARGLRASYILTMVHENIA